GRIDLVGRGDGAVGEIFVRGGSTWVSNAEATVGEERFSSFGVNGAGADGSLIVEEGSTLTLTGEGATFHIGGSAGAEGYVGVLGAGSRLEGDAFDLFVGGSRVTQTEEGETVGGVGGNGILEASEG